MYKHTPPNTVPNKKLNAYLNKGHKRIFGWLHPESIKVIAELGRIQQDFKIEGGVGEIGVHHGKLFMLLHLMTSNHERSFAIDVFENQEKKY